MMRQVQRRRLINGARTRGEATLIAIAAPLLDRRYKALQRELRRANLRKRLYKTQRDTGRLFLKAEVDTWNEWIQAFGKALDAAMPDVITDLYGAEEKFWLSRQMRPDPVDAARIQQAYLAREGRQIKDIAEDTRDQTLATITDWYNTDAGLPELIDQLAQYYTRGRAETIGRTESTFISSGVSKDMMHQFGVELWNWDLADEDGEWPCDPCREMADGGPYQAGDPMPPLHPRDRCGVVYVLDDGEFYGADIDVDAGGSPILIDDLEDVTPVAPEGPQFVMSPEAARRPLPEIVEGGLVEGVAAQAPFEGDEEPTEAP